MIRHRPPLMAALTMGLWLTLPPAAQAQQWSFHGVVAEGEQADAVAGPAGNIHLVSAYYYQLDLGGNILLQESHGDPLQNPMLFPPAIAVSPDGSVHVVTRDSGDFDNGYLDGYHRRQTGGAWTAGYTYNSPVQWNWQVGVAADGLGHVHMMSSNMGGNVWADLQIYQDNGGSAAFIGNVSDVYRVDFEARMRGRNGRIYLAAGNHFTTSSAVFTHGDGGPGLAGQLQANIQHLTAGAGSEKGFPDLNIDGQGQIHFTYGSGHTDHNQFPASTAGCVPGEVHYNQFHPDGSKVFTSDTTLFTGLGVWHLSIGLSAVAASDDGNTVVAVALRTPDQKEGWDSDLLWAASTDGGATWTAAQDLGVNTNAGEGRQRPRLVALGSKFFLFYRDYSTPGISLATIPFPEATPQPPGGLDAVAVSFSQIDLCWQDNASDEDGFVVERDSGAGFAEIATPGANVTCFSDTGLAPETAHTYRVRSYRGALVSSPSNEASATTLAPGVVVDGGLTPDGALQPTDGAVVSDAQSDAATPPGDGVQGGCACRSSHGAPTSGTSPPPSLGLVLFVLACFALWRCRRRLRQRG